jgi:hypothetical protein
LIKSRRSRLRILDRSTCGSLSRGSPWVRDYRSYWYALDIQGTWPLASRASRCVTFYSVKLSDIRRYPLSRSTVSRLKKKAVAWKLSEKKLSHEIKKPSRLFTHY